MKVTKFGGSSMADATQYRKVRDIVLADPARKVVVVSAAGKRHSKDHKLTDLLYLCYSHTKYGVECDPVFDMIKGRYCGIRDELGIELDMDMVRNHPRILAGSPALFRSDNSIADW